MNTSNPNDADDPGNAYVEQWLEITRRYLFAETEDHARESTQAPPVPSRMDSQGARDRYLSRVRGKLLRRLRRTPNPAGNALQELEHAFRLQVAFIAQHPDVPKRLLGWLSQGRDSRTRRRIRMVVAHYESRLSRIIVMAKQQGRVRSDVDPRAAAGVVVGMIQSLALRMNINLRQREQLLHEAIQSFFLFRAGMTVPSK